MENNTTFRIIGASNHCDHERQNEDYYATDPNAVKDLLKLETFSEKSGSPLAVVDIFVLC